MKTLTNLLMGLILAVLAIPAVAASAVAVAPSKYMSFDEFVEKNKIPIPAVFPEEARATRLFPKSEIRAKQIAILAGTNNGIRSKIERCVTENAEIIARNYDIQHRARSYLSERRPLVRDSRICNPQDPLMQKAISTIKITTIPDFALFVRSRLIYLMSPQQTQAETARYAKIFNEIQQ